MKNGGDHDDEYDDEFDEQYDQNHPNHHHRSNSTSGSTNPFHRPFDSGGRPRGVESVASLSSGLAQQARSLVGSFACTGINDRTGGVLRTELHEEQRHDNSDYRRSQKNRLGGASGNHNNRGHADDDF
jgi:hypothetical protein